MRNYRQSRVFTSYIKRFIGLPYHWGGDDPIDGFDCSGLVIEGLKAIGMVQRGYDDTAAGLFRKFMPKKVYKARSGVLAFYGSGHVTHIAICIDGKHVVEAGGGGSATNTRIDAADQNAYIRVRPLHYRSDFMGLADPFISDTVQ